MRRTYIFATIALVAAGGCRTAQVESDLPSAAPSPAGAERAIVPPGTQVEVVLDERLTAKENDVGDRFTATVKEDVSRSGEIIVPEGSRVTGKITGLDPAEKVGDQAAIRLAFESIEVEGTTHAFAAEVVDVDASVVERVKNRETGEKAAIGAATGAVIGAVIGGSLKDLLIGGALGAGAGTIISLGMGDVDSALPEGTDLTLRTTSAVAAR
jgi:hypothetical protein